MSGTARPGGPDGGPAPHAPNPHSAEPVADEAALADEVSGAAASSARRTPWYREGLAFRCTQCGQCCSGEPGYVFVNGQEIAELAAAMGLDGETFERRFVRRVGRRKSLVEYPDGDCIFLDPDSRRCTVYHARPTQCRTWPFWSSNLRSKRAWKETCEVCPGAGTGRVYTLGEIEERRKQ